MQLLYTDTLSFTISGHSRREVVQTFAAPPVSDCATISRTTNGNRYLYNLQRCQYFTCGHCQLLLYLLLEGYYTVMYFMYMHNFCTQVSKVFDPFMFLSLPIPPKKTRRVDITIVFHDRHAEKVCQLFILHTHAGTFGIDNHQLRHVARTQGYSTILLNHYCSHFISVNHLNLRI